MTQIPASANIDAALRQAAAHYQGGRLAQAEALYRQALLSQPRRSDIHAGLALILFQLGRTDEAIAAFQGALQIAPDDTDTLYKLGNLLLREGGPGRDRIAECFSVFRRHAQLTFGTPSKVGADAPHRIRHDREQQEYLTQTYGIADARFHLADGERISSRTINPTNAAKATQDWNSKSPRIIVIDNLLSEEALRKLRLYCWGSTIWRETHPEGYLTAMPEHGLACPFIAQIDEDMRSAYPAILGDHLLRYLWAFKYDSRMGGVGTHADPSLVTFNFWITPDEANLDPERGGLTVWDVAAPQDWNTQQYIGNTAGSQVYVRRQGGKAMTVPYRSNRALVFASDLFHETDAMHFKEGYTNRRINLTMLYGRR